MLRCSEGHLGDRVVVEREVLSYQSGAKAETGTARATATLSGSSIPLLGRPKNRTIRVLPNPDNSCATDI